MSAYDTPKGMPHAELTIIPPLKEWAFSFVSSVNMLQENSEKEDFEKIMVTIEKIVLKLYMMPKIIVSAIQGSAVGLGLSLALTADYVIAQSDAKLGVLFMGIGLAPDGGGHFFLSERLGVHKAKQFTWGLQQVTGKEAKDNGVSRHCDKRRCIGRCDRASPTIISCTNDCHVENKAYVSSREAGSIRILFARGKRITMGVKKHRGP